MSFFNTNFCIQKKIKKTNLCAQNVFEVFAMCFSPELLNFIFKKKIIGKSTNILKIRNNLFCSFKLAENIF